MKKKILIFILIFASIILILTYLSKIRTSSDVYVECIYIRYACNDCYPKYYVKFSSFKKIENKDIFILAKKNKNFIDIIELLDYQGCEDCSIFKVKGKLFYSIYRNIYTIETEDYIIKTDTNCCNTIKKELEKLQEEFEKQK